VDHFVEIVLQMFLAVLHLFEILDLALLAAEADQ